MSGLVFALPSLIGRLERYEDLLKKHIKSLEIVKEEDLRQISV